MNTPTYPVDEIVMELRKQRRQALREEGGRAEELSEAINQVMDWAEGKLVGPFPVDLARFGLAHLIPQPTEPVAFEGVTAPVQDAAPAPPVALVQEPSVGPPAPTTAKPSPTANEIERRERLRQEARAAEARGDRATAEQRWRELLALAPGDPEAQRALQQRAQAVITQSLRNKLSELRLKANSQSLRDLDDAIRLAQELRTAEVLDEATFEQVQELENKAKAKRADLKARSGEIETMAGLGQLREAIHDLEGMIQAGVYEIEDREGNIVPSAVKLAELNQAYATFCTQKAREYLARAEQSLPAFPKAAVEVLNKALEEFDKADADVRAELERRRTEVQELITRWEEAQGLIARAQQAQDPHQRLALLEEARTHYKDFENLDALIEQARQDAAAAIVHDVRVIYQNARFLLQKANLEEAQRIAVTARERAKNLRGASTLLDAELAQVDDLINQIAHQAALRRVVEEARTEVEKLLRNHDPIGASQHIELLSEEERQQPAIKALQGQIARARGAETTYQLAQKRFQAGDWQGVLDLLDPKGDGVGDASMVQLDERMEGLRTKAAARRAYQEGLELMEEDPATAERSFELAKLTDPGLAAMVKPHLDQIAEWKRQTGAVRQLLDDAADLEEKGKLAEAFAKLTQARGVSSPLKREAEKRWLAVRSAWRQALLDRLARIPHESAEAKAVIDAIRQNALLDAAEDQRQVAAAEMTYYRAQATRAVQARPPRWEEAARAWESCLAVEPDDPEAQEGLRQALREAALAAARREFSATRDGAKALAVLEGHLKDERLQNDPEFLKALVETAAQYGDFERAAQYLDALRLVEPTTSRLVQEAEQRLRETQAWAEAKERSNKSFADGQYLAAVQVLDDVLRTYSSAPTQGQWQREREDVQRRAVNALMEKARQLRQHVSGPGRTEVISLYSQAIQLGGEDVAREAKKAIEEIKNELPDLVRVVVEEAERFNPDNSDPLDAQREAERLLGRLRDFRQVTNYMGGEGERWRRSIAEAEQKLGNQLDMLVRVNKLLYEVRTLLRNPTSDKTLAEAETNLKEAKRLFSKAAGLSDLEAELSKVKSERKEAKKLIEQLKRAAQDVDDPNSFSRVIEACRSLKRLDPEDRFALQTPGELLVYYTFLDKNVDTLEEHERLAREQQANYKVYWEWRDKCQPAQEKLTSALQEVDEKRKRGSLDEQQDALARAVELCQAALEAFAARPKADPLSFLAQDISEEIGGWQATAQREQKERAAELAQVQEKRQRRDEIAGQLQKLLEQRPVSANKSAAERRLSELRALDPYWPRLAELEKKHQAWLAPKKSSLFSFGR